MALATLRRNQEGQRSDHKSENRDMLDGARAKITVRQSRMRGLEERSHAAQSSDLSDSRYAGGMLMLSKEGKAARNQKVLLF